MFARTAILLVLLSPLFAHACSCEPRSKDLQRAVTESWRNASVVVAAEALEATMHQGDQKPFGPSEMQAVTWRVTQSWKGAHVPGESFDTDTVVQCCLCGRRVQKGDTFVLYLHGSAPYSISTCSMSGPTSGLQAQIRLLDKVAKPGASTLPQLTARPQP